MIITSPNAKENGKGKGKGKQKAVTASDLPLLHRAVLLGDTEGVRRAIQTIQDGRAAGSNELSCRELVAEDGSTALHYACAYARKRRDPAEFDEKIEVNMHVSFLWCWGSTLLYEC